MIIGGVLGLFAAAVIAAVLASSGGSSNPSHSASASSNPPSAGATGNEQVIGELSPGTEGGMVVSVKLLEFPKWPQTVVVDLTGPGVPSSITLRVPEAGVMKTVYATIDTGCPSSLQTWKAHVASIGGHPLTALEEKGASWSASVGPCVKTGG
jgi:hypothetical protein